MNKSLQNAITTAIKSGYRVKQIWRANLMNRSRYGYSLIIIIPLMMFCGLLGHSKQNYDLTAFNKQVDSLIQASSLDEKRKELAQKNISDWLDRCMSDDIALVANWTNILDIREIIKVASESPLVCDKFVPIAEDPNSYGQKTILSLPFDGIWHVVQGNRGIVSHLKGKKGEFAWDFIIHKSGKQAEGDAGMNENHFCWGQPLIAPAPGIIVETLDSLHDHDPYLPDPPQVGNHVYIDHQNGEISLLYHLMYQSVVVHVGQSVDRGQKIGLCGDTGISMFPHLHYQLFHGDLNTAEKMQTRFSGYYSWTGTESIEDFRKSRKLRLSGVPKRLEYVVNVSNIVNKKSQE